MCLYIKENVVKEIAIVNIPVYKQLSKDGRSLMANFYYFRFWRNFKVNLKIIHDRFGYSLEQGYHSRMWNSVRSKDYLFIIPKGAEYYRGKENSHSSLAQEDGYISNTIIYVGKNNSFNRKLAKFLYNVTFKF